MEITERGKNQYKISDRALIIVWEIEDVQTLAKESKIDLDIDACNWILKQVKKDYDANFGVTWDTISTAIDKWISYQETKEPEDNIIHVNFNPQIKEK